MEYNLFIIPITLIVVELIKRAELVNTKYLPIFSLFVLQEQFSYRDLFEHMGLLFLEPLQAVFMTQVKQR